MSVIDAGGRPARRSRPTGATTTPRARRPSASTNPAARPRPAARTRARRTTTRTRALGRTASLTNGIVFLVIGVVAFAIVALQVGVLRANMDAATIQSQIRSTRVQTADVQNAIATQLSDGRIDAAARAAHMVMAPPDAIRSVPPRLKGKAGKRAAAR
jgi:cell division protein FtsL